MLQRVESKESKLWCKKLVPSQLASLSPNILRTLSSRGILLHQGSHRDTQAAIQTSSAYYTCTLAVDT